MLKWHQDSQLPRKIKLAMPFTLSKLLAPNDVIVLAHIVSYLGICIEVAWMVALITIVCSVDNQVYVLAAKDNSSAIKWIEKLQVSRIRMNPRVVVITFNVSNRKSVVSLLRQGWWRSLKIPLALTNTEHCQYMSSKNYTVTPVCKRYYIYTA